MIGNFSFAQLQVVDWKHQVVRFVNIGSTPSSPYSYNWEEELTSGQGIHINLTPTEIVNIYIEKENAKIVFGHYISSTDVSHFLIYLDINVDDQGYQNLYQGSAKMNVIWDCSQTFNSISEYNLKVKFMVANSSEIFFREYNIKVVEKSDKLFKDQYGNSIRLWKGKGNSTVPILLSPGFDAYNTKPEQYYRYAGSELFDCLLNNSFDIYVLYYKFNPQDLRNNAAVYSSAVEYISSNLNNSKNIIAAGISMGGIITRYALTKAEHNGTPLPVDKWISLDAPHQGAYVSKSLQDFLKDQTTNDFDKYASDNIAAKILLMYNAYDVNPNGFNIENGENRGSFHANFYNELNSLNGDGYPHLTYNIGVSFSSNLPSSNYGKWLNIKAGILMDKDVHLEPLERDAGSYLPKLNIDPSIILPLWGFIWATLTVTQYQDPVFIQHSSSLDIINGISKFSKTISPLSTGFHDVIPSELIPEILSEILPDEIYLQNQIIVEDDYLKARNVIISGRNVTNVIPVGDYIIEPNSVIVFQSGNQILLKPGFHTKSGSNFTAYIDANFSCESPKSFFNSIVTSTDDNHSEYFELNSCKKSFAVSEVCDDENNEILLNAYPNPFNNITTFTFSVTKSCIASFVIFSSIGVKVFILDNIRLNDNEIKAISFPENQLPKGVYYGILQTESKKKIIKIIKQ
jgi:hypothetical protein